jgi:hypothetical protein
MSDFITFAEVARRLGIARATATSRLRSGDIPGAVKRFSYEKTGQERWAVKRQVFEFWAKKAVQVEHK